MWLLIRISRRGPVVLNLVTASAWQYLVPSATTGMRMRTGEISFLMHTKRFVYNRACLWKKINRYISRIKQMTMTIYDFCIIMVRYQLVIARNNVVDFISNTKVYFTVSEKSCNRLVQLVTELGKDKTLRSFAHCRLTLGAAHSYCSRHH